MFMIVCSLAGVIKFLKIWGIVSVILLALIMTGLVRTKVKK